MPGLAVPRKWASGCPGAWFRGLPPSEWPRNSITRDQHPARVRQGAAGCTDLPQKLMPYNSSGPGDFLLGRKRPHGLLVMTSHTPAERRSVRCLPDVALEMKICLASNAAGKWLETTLVIRMSACMPPVHLLDSRQCCAARHAAGTLSKCLSGSAYVEIDDRAGYMATTAGCRDCTLQQAHSLQACVTLCGHVLT